MLKYATMFSANKRSENIDGKTDSKNDAPIGRATKAIVFGE
jgi:hypothetical protein